jgi:hypothetical protein
MVILTLIYSFNAFLQYNHYYIYFILLLLIIVIIILNHIQFYQHKNQYQKLTVSIYLNIIP